METRIILTILCFTMSFLSLIRGLYLIKAEQKSQHSSSGTLFNSTDITATLKLVFFNGIKSRDGLLLMWQPDTTLRNYKFDIERREPDGSFITIASIANKKMSDGAFRFIDPAPHKDAVYRLKQTDLLGISHFSKLVLFKEC